MKFGNILFTGWLLAYVHAESGAERAEILQDNEDFWHRFVKHQDSLATAVPSTSGGTPRPTPAPNAPPMTPSPSSSGQTLTPTMPRTTPPASSEACLVELEVECRTIPTEDFPDGLPCDQITEPSRVCSGGSPTEVVEFSYFPGPCTGSSNSQGANAMCEDFTEFAASSETVVVGCTDTATGTTMDVQPVVIGEGNVFTVSNPEGGALPSSVTCSLSDENGEMIQTNAFDVSGAVALNLKDRFGALVLDSCDDTSCLETISYTYDINNEGTTEMTVNVVDRTFTAGGTILDVDLVNLVNPNPMEPGQVVTIEDTFTIDICRPGAYEIDVTVNASSPDDLICFADGQYSFTVGSAPVTPAPVSGPPVVAPTSRPSTGSMTPAPTNRPSSESDCVLDFSIACEVNGEECTALPPTIEMCTDRPYAMTMLLNGGDCNQSYSVQLFQPDKFSCTDVVEGGVPTEEGTDVFVVVYALNDPSIVYTYEYVPVGSTFQVNDGEQRFEADQNVTIYSSDQIGYDTMLQTLNFHTSCSQDLFLKDRFGAVQVVEWVNEEQGVVSSFANASFDVSVTIPMDITGSTLTLESFFAVTNFGVYNFTDDVIGQVVVPGASVQVTFDVTFDLTQPRRYTILAEIEGTTDEGSVCTGTAFYNFTTGVDLPDTFPSDAPAVSPGGASKTGETTGGNVAGGETVAVSKGGASTESSDDGEASSTSATETVSKGAV